MRIITEMQDFIRPKTAANARER